jgi:hypothetical protein
MGRPSIYSEELANAICERIANGESLRKICRDEGMPDRATIYRWMDSVEGFATKCARSRLLQGDHVEDEIADVIDDTRYGRLDPQAARVVLSGMQWRASKLNPKKYGDKLTLGGDPDQPLTHKITFKE